MTPTREFVEGVMRNVYLPQAALNAWQWGEENIVLDAEESIDFAGPYDTSLTPWHRFILECLTDPEVRECWIMKSSQTGVTLAMIIAICYVVKEMPVHVLYAIDSVTEARKISISRLKPKLQQVFRDANVDVDEEHMTNLFIRVRGMVIHLIGGGSAGAFANKTVGLALLDELDKHRENPGGEANTADLARSRLKRVSGGKLFGWSSPARWMGPIHSEHETGSRHKLFVPCPYCGHMQHLEWKQVKFEHCKDMTGEWDYDRVKSETYYECIECEGHIEEPHKPGMLEEMEPRPTNENQDQYRRVPGKISLHISDLYSTFPNSSWGDLAVQWLSAQGDSSKVQDFYNSRLGLPRPEKKSEVQLPMVAKMKGGYETGCCPVMPAWDPLGNPAIFVSADVQKDVKKAVKGVFQPDGTLYIVDYHQTLSFGELDHFLSQTVACGVNKERDAKAVHLPGDWGIIDEGHMTKDVRSFVLSSGRFSAAKGRGGVQVRDVVEEKTNFEHEGMPFAVYFFSDDDFKHDLYVGRIGQHKAIVEGNSPIPRLWLPAYADDEFMQELCQERRIQKRVKGRLRWTWDEPKGANDFGDAVKMLLVLWWRMRDVYTLWERPEVEGEEAEKMEIIKERVRRLPNG